MVVGQKRRIAMVERYEKGDPMPRLKPLSIYEIMTPMLIGILMALIIIVIELIGW